MTHEHAADSFSGRRTADIVGITYRQLDYWARTDLIRPSIADAAGSGSRRAYSYNDLLELRIIKRLLDAGIRLEQVRRVFEYLRARLDERVAAAHLVIDDDRVYLCDDGELIDLLRSGQGVLNVMSVDSVRSDLDAELTAANHVGVAEPAIERQVS